MTKSRDPLGWAKLWRRFAVHPLWRQQRVFSEAEAFIDMFAFRALGIDGDIVGGEPSRGEFDVTVRELSESWNWSLGTVHRFLNKLTADEMIFCEYLPATRRTRIRILHYAVYQGADLTDRQGQEIETPFLPGMDRVSDSGHIAFGTINGTQFGTQFGTMKITASPKPSTTSKNGRSKVGTTIGTTIGTINGTIPRAEEDSSGELNSHVELEDSEERDNFERRFKEQELLGNKDYLAAGKPQPVGDPFSAFPIAGEKMPSLHVRDEAHDYFCKQHLIHRKVPYDFKRKTGDFVALDKLRKAQGKPPNAMPDGWETACGNYFISDLRSFTIAHLAGQHFDIFLEAPVDRFGKRIGGKYAERESEAAARERRSREAGDRVISRLADRLAEPAGGGALTRTHRHED